MLVHNSLLSLDGERLSRPSIPNQEKEKPYQPKVDKENKKVEQEISNWEKAKELGQKGFAALQSTGRQVKEAVQEIPDTVKHMANINLSALIQEKIVTLKEDVVEIGENIVRQIATYMAVFILNTVIFPIIFLYGFYRLGKYLMTIDLMPLFNE